MRFLLSAALILAGIPSVSFAQAATSKVVIACGIQTYSAGSKQYPTQDTTGTACSSATGGGGGPITAAAASYATGFSVDFGKLGDAACSTDNGAACDLIQLVMRTNQRTTAIIAALGSPFQAGGSVTANAGTNLNTSALALETGGNLAAAKSDLDAIILQLPSSRGIKTSANSLSIAPASDASFPVTGTFWQATQPVSGTITANAAALTTGGAAPYHFVSTASTNSTLISTGAHTLYSLTITGLNTTAAYVRLYDTAAAPTCSSATGASHSYPVVGSATTQGGLVVPLTAQGELYANGLSFCITGGGGDTDNTAAVVGVYVNASYK